MATVNGIHTYRERFELLKTVEDSKDVLIEVCFSGCSSCGMLRAFDGRIMGDTVYIGTCT